MNDLQTNEELLKEIEALKQDNASMKASLEKKLEKKQTKRDNSKHAKDFRSETVLIDVEGGYLFADAHGNVKFRTIESHDNIVDGNAEDRVLQAVNRGLPGDRRPVMPGFSH